MTTWLDFLTAQGARFNTASSPQVVAFGENDAMPTARDSFVVPLTHLGLISATGDEAADFLHKQLSNDIEHLDHNAARLAGYCTPKGRLLANLLIWKNDQGPMLQLPREIQSAVQKRLQMFILRSKVKLTDVTENCVALGLAGSAAASVLMPWFPTLPLAIYDKVESDAGILIRHPNAIEVPRYQWITDVDTAMAAWPRLSAVLQPVGAAAWHLAEIDSGTPHITGATQEKFVPQMINFELIGGVSFKKGCYPGQEIVARSQYLGKPKRRMLHASVTALHAEPGIEVFSADDAEQPCGMIVNAEHVNAQEIDCLVEIKLAATASAVHLGSATGPILAFKPLPYELIDPT